jgi:hypothetical protein
MSNLASTYSELGMHQDAFVLREEALDVFRRALPDDHPEIGSQSGCRRSCDGPLMRHFCRGGHEQSRARSQRTRSAQGST